MLKFPVRGSLWRQRPWHRIVRNNSNSSSSSSSTELTSGLPLLASTLWRCATSYPTLEAWEDKELIPSSLSAWDRHRLFLLLHTPAQLEFDADEFLAGSKIAIEQLLRTTKSRGFAEYVRTRGVDATNEDVVNQVKMFCTPRGLTFHEDATRQQLDRKMIVEAELVEVESVQLSECVYGQVTESEFQQELQGKRVVVNEITDNATIERLFVSVKATVKERLRRELLGEEVQILEQKNVYYAVLASNVTTRDVVDWAFVANVLANTVRSNEISRTELTE